MNNEEKILQMLTNLTTEVSGVKDGIADIKERTIRTEVLIENEIIPNIQLLAEGHLTIQHQIKNISVIERLEDEISTLKLAVKFLASEVENLKKAI